MTPDTIPAATLILMREGVPSADRAVPWPEILMVERGAALAFLGGAMVFPGGRVDPADYALVAPDATDRDDAAARVAVIRETIEEVGLCVGLTPYPDPDTCVRLRAAMADGQPFAAALQTYALRIDPTMLTPFARWSPEHVPVRRFDARFYLAAVPRQASKPVVDGGETVRAEWLTAAAALDQADRGGIRIILPTRRTLERLALYRDLAAGMADAKAWPIRRIVPFREDRDGVPHVCIPDDLGYPVTAQPVASAERG